MATRVEAVFKPQTEDAIMDLKVFHDFSDTPYEWTGTLAADDNNGIRVTDGEPELTVDLTKANGFAEQQMDRHRDVYMDGTHYISIEASGVGGEEPTTIFEFTIDGAAQ